MDMSDRLLREPEVARITGLGRTTRWEMEKSGEFPARRRAAKNVSGWLESEVLDWIRSRAIGGPTAAVRLGNAVEKHR
jgi:prophage regulatory protein